MKFSTKNLIKIMLLIIIVLAFMAGFYQSALSTERKKSQYLEGRIDKLENKVEGMDF